MIIVKSNNSQPEGSGRKVVTIYVPKNYNVTGTLQLVVKDRATDEEIVFDNPGDNNPSARAFGLEDNAFPGSSYQPSDLSLQVGSYHLLTIDTGRLEPSTEYEYTLIAKDVEKIIGRGLLRTE